MPLTTYLSDRDLVLDATRDESDVGGGLSWEQVHGNKTLPMTCRECGHGMHPRGGGNRGKRPHFAHDQNRPKWCTAGRERPEHRELKRRCAEWAREAGWHADLEVTSPTGDWRADVLATDPQSQRRIAFEIQLSSQTEEEARRRSTRYREAGVECVWIVHGRRRRWFRTHGALVVTETTGSADSAQERDWTVVEGCQRYMGTEKGGIFIPAAPVPLSRVVYSIVRGQVVPSRTDPYSHAAAWWWIRADCQQHWTEPVALPNKLPSRRPKRKPASRSTRTRTRPIRSSGAPRARPTSEPAPTTPSSTTAAPITTDLPPAPPQPEPPPLSTPEPPAAKQPEPQANPQARVPTPPRDLTLGESLAAALGGPWSARKCAGAAVFALFLGMLAAIVSAAVTNVALHELTFWVVSVWGAVILLGSLIWVARRRY